MSPFYFVQEIDYANKKIFSFMRLHFKFLLYPYPQ